MRNAREWSTELVKRDGEHAYTDMIRAPGDPERSPRRPKGDPLRDTLALWRRRLLKDSIADWAPRIFDHLADGQARTLNRIGVEMIDKTADNLLSTPFHEALWSLVEMGSVEHTMRAPILFRRRRIEGPVSSLVSPADDEPTPAAKDERLPAPEEWRPVVGHDGYEVSSLGRVRSWRKSGRSTDRRDAPLIRKQVPNPDRGGYLSLIFIVDGRSVSRYVHHLVLEAFKGMRPDGTETRHLDRIVTNNVATNLEWGTHAENVADQLLHGTDSIGDRNGGAKLTQEEAESIRESGASGKETAAAFGVSQATVSRVRKGSRYGVEKKLPHPFLKWAGSKRQLLGELLKHIPAKFSVYVEPMIGGGAMFFELRRLGILDDAKRIVLADINEELVNTYRIVRDDVGSLQRTLARFENTEAFYKCMRAVNPSSIDPVRRAARFIYLNRCGFNGLYRVNQSGQFNVPFGKAKNPTICNVPVLDAASQALKGVEIMCAQFPVTCLTAQVCRKGGPAQVAVPGGVVYFDPPYWPVSKTADFTAYDADGFGPDDHKAMRDLAVLMRAQGTHVVVSNADVEGVRELYRAEQFDLHRVEARRNINRDADKRGPVGELIMVAR